MRTRVKICGIAQPEDALTAVDAGADSIGLVFYRPSPRSIGIEAASNIVQSMPAFVSCTGLFVNAGADEIRTVLAEVPLQLLQFHGDETPEFCGQFGLPYIKALRAGREEGGLNGESLRMAIDLYAKACGILLDTYQKAVPGGTGEQFDWDLIPKTSRRIILAGGLNPANVADAIAAVNPYAVDVSGGVESTPGKKDADRIRAFLKAVNLASAAGIP